MTGAEFSSLQPDLPGNKICFIDAEVIGSVSVMCPAEQEMRIGFNDLDLVCFHFKLTADRSLLPIRLLNILHRCISRRIAVPFVVLPGF